MKINAEWHANHPMPPRPTAAQRLAWHLAHQKRCGCRPMPPSLLRAVRTRVKSTESTRSKKKRSGRRRPGYPRTA